MKSIKKIRCFLALLFVALGLVVIAPGDAYAATNIELAIDGIRIPVSITDVETSVDFIPANLINSLDDMPFYSGVSADLSGGRSFVPLRLFTNIYDAKLEWKSPDVLVTYGETTVRLNAGSKTAYINQTAVTLAAAPYFKTVSGFASSWSTLMVPVGFINEVFGCYAEYKDGLLNIKTAPLMIDGKRAVRMINESFSPEYHDYYALKANLFIKKMYQTIFDGHGAEVSHPDALGLYVNMDPLVYYYGGNNCYSILNTSDEVLAQFIIYVASGNGLPHPEGTHEYLLYDNLNKKWYSIPLAVYASFEGWDLLLNKYRDSYIGGWDKVESIDSLGNWCRRHIEEIYHPAE